MHTDTCLSDFKPTGQAAGSASVPATRAPVFSLELSPAVFSNATGDNLKSLVDEASRMREQMKQKDELLFAPLVDARLKVHTPFAVRIINSGDGVSAHAAEIQEFGYGTNRGEALDDLARTIAELYFSLDSERGRLSSDLDGVLKSLEQHITRVHL